MSTLSVQTIKDVQSFDFANTTFANAYNVSNAAFGRANTALQNTSGTFTGNLSVTGNVGIGTSSSTFNLDISGALRCLSSSEGIQTTGDTIGRDLLAGRSNVATCIGYVGGSAMVQGTNFSLSATPDLTLQPYGGNTRFLSSATFFKTDGNPGKGSKIFLAGSDNGDQWIGAGQNTAYWMEYSANTNEGHVFRTGSVERIVISGASSSGKVPANSISLNPFSAGYVTMPNQPAFSVSYSGGGYVASEGDSNTWDAVLWNTATGSGRFNNGNHYNGATGCFTAPVSGKYMFMTQIHHHAGGGTTSGYAYMDLAFGTTGSQAAIVGATSFHRNIMTLTTDTWWEMPPQVTILNLAANDSIFVRIVNTGGATFLGASRTDHNRWSCWFLG